MCRARQPSIESSTIDELSVRSFGDAAVVTGRTIATTGGASPETVRLRFTDVFIRRAGRWQVVASHATGIAP
jgi:ketosteroid isomerase-like protein